jgi:beta-glucosidase
MESHMRRRAKPVAIVIGTAATWVLLAGAATPIAANIPPTAPTPIYLNTAYSPQERAADLVSRLTLPEKAAEMNSSQAAAIPRLGIQAYGWWNESAHGVARQQTNNGGNPPTLTNTTSYPVDLSLGSTWNPALMYQEAGMISDEAREVAPNNTEDLDYYSPTVNLARDPRWGRDDETFSEDPLLTGAIASQFVDGMEGKTSDGTPLRSADGYLKTVTTIKHFAANNSEFNRRTGSSDMDERTLREYYTAQFRNLIQQASPGSIMSSYNEINGVPTAADVHLMDTLARETYGFDGYFTSDCDAVYEIQAGHHWQPPGYTQPLNADQRTAFANSAGEDLNCDEGYHDASNYGNTIPDAVGQHIVTQTDTYNEGDVDTSLVRLFAARIETGEFDNESTVPWVAKARAALAPGTWVNSDANKAVTETPARLAEARKVGDQSIVLLKNDAVKQHNGKSSTLLPLKVPSSGSYKVAVIGYYANPTSMYLGGYSSNQGTAGVANEVNGYQGLKTAIQQVNPNAQVDFLPGVTGTGLATVDPASVAAAANYDAVVVYAGTDASTATEDKDRTSLALPGAQASLISQVAAVNPNTVVYLETLGEVDTSAFAGSVPAMLWSSYNGERKGDSLADVVLGKYNPSGRLPFSWYADVNQLPAIGDYNIRPTATTLGRTYMYFTGQVSYPFGYGLSYDRFRYTNLKVDRSHLDANDTLRVSADVSNTGTAAGDDVAQLYVTTPDAPAALQRPLKRLEGFQKISLKAHQTRHVDFTVKVPDLAFFNESSNTYQVDDGRYGIQLGTSSANGDIQQQTTVHVSGKLRPTPSVVTAKPVAADDAAQQVAQRVIFPAGTVVDPQLTVSLSDESLFGYITEGASTALPAGMKVTYRSNRSKVVSVSRSGTIRTVGTGVATVTATVDYHGARSSGTFVVDVQ